VTIIDSGGRESDKNLILVADREVVSCDCH
jgi:hypothetical protein